MTILDEEAVVWFAVSDSLPDADTTVLVYCPTDDAEPVWLGFYEGNGQWYSVDGASYEPADTITAWAAMPNGPSA